MSFLYTDRFEDLVDALTSDYEGIVWKSAVPKEIISLVTSFDFSRFSSLNGKGYHRGRDSLKQETTAVTWLKKKFPELELVDKFALDVKSQFASIPKLKGRPRLGRWNSPPLPPHFWCPHYCSTKCSSC